MATMPHLPASLPKDGLDHLTHLAALLHLLHHRNKNQHRRSVWYRHFSLFRRHLSHLVSDYTFLSSEPSTNLERTRKKAREPQIRTHIEQRLEFWETVLVPKWSRAFGQVVADGRFAVTGIVIVGILASTCQVTGLTAQFEDLGQLEVERVLEEFGREAWEGETRGMDSGDHDDVVGEAAAREGMGSLVTREDEGEAVARDSDEGEAVPREDALPLPKVDEMGDAAHAGLDDGATAKPTEPIDRQNGKGEKTDTQALKKAKKRPADADGKPAKKKTRKKGNAIDDLFNGL